MKINLLFYLLLTLIYAGCSQEHSNEANHNHESGADHSGESGLDHKAEEIPKIQFTEYTTHFELFAESDVLIAGEHAQILAHFTKLPSFKPLRSGRVTVSLNVNGKEALQSREQPVRPGIYQFEIKPDNAGIGNLVFEIDGQENSFKIEVSDVRVFSNQHQAIDENPEHNHAESNSIVFTKEQSWKIDFATQPVSEGPFSNVIKTTAIVQPAPAGRVLITAKTSGIVSLSKGFIVPGTEVDAGETLFTISGSGMADNNFAVRFTEVRNNYETAKQEYERMKALAEDKIVTESQLLAAKNKFENANVKFENLQQHFDASGQKVYSPVAGMVEDVFVHNGQHIENGTPVLRIIDDENLMLRADVSSKCMDVLGTVTSGNIRILPEGRIVTLGDFSNGNFIFGKATNTSNYLIPVSIKLNWQTDLIPGQFVELYLKAQSSESVITVPNSSLLEEQGSFYVFVQITPELFEKRLVKSGATDGMKTEIISGLSAHNRIVTSGSMLIKLAQTTGTLDAHSGHVH